jgi:hypothetical protein
MVTVTVPYQLRNPIWRDQKKCYNILFSSSVKAMEEIAENNKYLGGTLGMTGVLHTHARNLDFHPHIHFIVPGGAIDKSKSLWIKKRGKYLFPWKKLSLLFKGKFLAELLENGVTFSNSVYKKEWRVNIKDAGDGEGALLYLSRYLYRGVISEKRIKNNNDGNITFSYIDSKTGKERYRTMKGEDFLFHILQHVLPKGYRRSRDYGFLHGNAKKTLHLLQILLIPKISDSTDEITERPKFKCPNCGVSMNIINQTFNGSRHFLIKIKELNQIPVLCG